MTDTHSQPFELSRRSLLAAGVATIALAVLGEDAFAAAASADVTEKEVSVTTQDGMADAVLFHPAKGRGPWPAVILWPDLAGLRPSVRSWGRSLAAAGFVVLMPNSFYRSARASSEEVNLADPEIRTRQMAYRAAATDDGIARDAAAYLAFLDAQKQTAKGRKVGTVGYDVGGSYAFRAAAALPDRVAVVGSVYGLGVATARPNSPHLLVPRSNAAYHVAISRDDDAREPDDKVDIRKLIAQGNLEGTVEVYPANHGWATPGSPSYDPASAGKALTEIVKLLKAKLW